MRISDWSSDVCSSDLLREQLGLMGERGDPRSPRSSLGDGDIPRTITSSMLHGGPLRIWSAITDPDHRRAWSLLVFLANPCQLGDRQSGVSGTRVSERVDDGGRRYIKQKKPL